MNTNSQAAIAIDLDRLSKHFRQTVAVNDLTLQVPAGSTFGLIGPNGAGKTTAIKMLMGVLRPDGGSATVLGHNVLREPVETKQRVGYVPELHHIDRWMRVYEVIGFCRSAYHNWNDKTCNSLLKRFELSSFKKVRQLSKGMLVKLSLVLAVSHDPELLVLDEPMAGLDPLAREEVMDGVLRTICDRGQTVLFSTHSLDDIQRLADTVGIMYEGRLLMHSNIERLLHSMKRIRTTIVDGKAPPKDLVPNVIWQQMLGRQWTVTVGDFQPQLLQRMQAHDAIDVAEVVDLGLEDVFKDIVKGRKGSQ
jgi:ABC-2 type transport system ATP-binding protein